MAQSRGYCQGADIREQDIFQIELIPGMYHVTVSLYQVRSNNT